MAPPQVNLGGKEPLKTVGVDEALPEKGDGAEFPTIVVTAETQRRHWHQLSRERRRRCRVAVCTSVVMILLVTAVLGTMCLVHKLRRHHRKHFECHAKWDDTRLPEHVTVDHDKQLITAKHDHDNNGHTPAMEIMHEYSRGLIAYKDTEKMVCYIDRLDETFAEGYERWESYEKQDRDGHKALKVLDQREIHTEVLRHVADIHLWGHCHDAKSYWVMEIEETEITETDVVVRV